MNTYLIKYACIYNKHAQNYTRYATNGALTNGTPYLNQLIFFFLEAKIYTN